MKAIHIPTGKEYEITGTCYFRDAEDNLFIAVSYINDDGATETSNFNVEINNGEYEVIAPDYQIIL